MVHRLCVLAVVLCFAAPALFAQCPTNANAAQPIGPDGTNYDPGAAITFTWNASTVSGVTYDVVAWQNINSPTTICSNQTSTSCSTNSLTAAGQWSWAIKTKKNACPDQASGAKLFSIGCLSGIPGITSPANGATNVAQIVTFSWNGVSGADNYDIYWGPTANGNCGVNGQLATSSTTSFTPPQLQAGTTYGWRVVAKKAGCPDRTSACGTFTTASNTCLAPGTFNLGFPNSVTVGSTPTLQWGTSSGAAKYVVHIGTTNPPPTSVNDPLVTNTSYTPAPLTPGTTYYWNVDAYPSCSTTLSTRSSTTNSFTVRTCPTGSATLVAPANNSTTTNTTLTFNWTNVASALSYDLFISNDNGANFTNAGSTQAGTTSLIRTLPLGVYIWYVRTNFDAGCASINSQASKVTIAQNGCPTNPATPTTIAPADGATGLASPVTFQWSAVSGATGYVVFASLNNGASVPIGTSSSTQLSVNLPAGSYSWLVEAKFGENCPPTVSRKATFTVSSGNCTSNTAPTLIKPANGATNVQSPVEFDWHEVSGAIGYAVYAGTDSSQSVIGTTTESTLTRLVPRGTTTWFVEAFFPGCDPMRSATSHFAMAVDTSCDGLSITRISPADGATVSSPVTFQWSAVANASTYRLWLAQDGGAAEIFARTTNTSATVPVSSGNSKWYVEAVLTTCPNVLSSTGTITVPRAANCDSNAAPAAVAPTGNVTADKVTFQWNAAAGAAAYRVWLAVNNQPFAEIALTKEMSIERTLPAATYTWFVDALYENCPAVASARLTFVLENTTARCTNAAPTLVSPANNAANVSSPVTLLWSSVANAIEYRVYASLNDGAPRLIVTTPETSVTQPVLPGTISWSVEAVFRNCPATQSATSTFTVARNQNCSSDKPQLVSPADNAQGLTSPVTLSWNPLTGAVGYVVFARHGDGAPTAIGQTTSETTLSRNFPDGRIEWWVVAFIAGCDPAESTHFHFSVTTAAACDHRKPILIAPDQSDKVLSPVRFAWTAVAGATGYAVWIQQGTEQPGVVATSTEPRATADVPPGITRWFVEAKFNGCPSTLSAIAGFAVLPPSSECRTPDKPTAKVIGQVQSGASFTVRWTPLVNAGHYELQESTDSEFAHSTTYTETEFSHTFTYTVTAPTQYRYRVRGVSACSDESGPWSDFVGVFVMPLNVDPKAAKSSIEAGAQGNVVQTIKLPSQSTPTAFNATVDKPWLTVVPSSGTIGQDGVTLTVTSAPGTLNLGTNTGTVTVTYGALGKKGSDATTKTTVPISVSVVTPVSPVPRNTPQQDSLIIPGVAHAGGANNSLFQSDVRVANVSAQTMKYTLNFTPIATDGTQTGSSTTLEIEPGATTALDDILSSFFGNNSGSGTLEIRPLTTSTTGSSFASSVTPSTLSVNTITVASSRTYNVDAQGGTLGQFIPAIPYAKFIAKASSSSLTQILSLQQLANSSAYRTNIGLVEASGQAATVLMRVFDDANTLLAEIPVNLLAGQYVQDNYFAKNALSFTDGRVELQVTSTNGRVTAYASTIDNATNDPLLVSPVLKSGVAANHYVLPGIAALNTGAANWRSDVRVYNAGADTTATLTYIPMPGNTGAAQPVTVTLKAGEVAAFDDILKSKFNISVDSGGALSISTPATSSLITSARTYNLTTTGTLGQFIPGVTAADSVGNSAGSLQLLQLEQSDRYRTNIGLAETNGQPATVEVLLFLPDSKVTPVYTVPLEANQFVQFPLTVFNAGTVYNGRVSIKVISGSGKVTAYGSIIDSATGDPTLVPALR